MRSKRQPIESVKRKLCYWPRQPRWVVAFLFKQGNNVSAKVHIGYVWVLMGIIVGIGIIHFLPKRTAIAPPLKSYAIPSPSQKSRGFADLPVGDGSKFAGESSAPSSGLSNSFWNATPTPQVIYVPQPVAPAQPTHCTTTSYGINNQFSSTDCY